jgi:hypothetical protein
MKEVEVPLISDDHIWNMVTSKDSPPTSGSSLECSTSTLSVVVSTSKRRSLTPRLSPWNGKAAEIAEATVAKAKRLQYQKDFPKEAEAAMKGKRKSYGSCRRKKRLLKSLSLCSSHRTLHLSYKEMC